MKNPNAMLLFVCLCALGLSQGAHAQSRYADCQQEAMELSGYTGEEAPGLVAGALRGGLGGAALGAAGGWVTDKNTKKTAKRGAALGVLVGGVRAAAKQRESEDRREVYDRALQRCMERDA